MLSLNAAPGHIPICPIKCFLAFPTQGEFRQALVLEADEQMTESY